MTAAVQTSSLSEAARLLEVFRCEHFACRLTRAACAARQVKTWSRAYRRQTTAKQKPGQRLVKTGPVHPFCASGGCAQGREIAEMFPELVALGPSEPTRAAPRLDLVRAAEETSMACNECGSRTMHKADCTNRPAARGAGKPALPAKPKTARAAPAKVVAKEHGGITVMAVRALDTPSLLLVRETVERELQERLAQAETNLARLREAVSAAAARAAAAAPSERAA